MASFGDNFKRVISNTARLAVKKSGEVIETAKSKYNEYDLNGELDDLYRGLGKIVYNGFNEDLDISEEIKDLCEKIDNKIKELETIKNK